MTYEEAQRKARYGHRPWVFYRDRDGQTIATRATPEAIKGALLACGTQRAFTLLCGDGTPMRMSWRLGLIALANARAGYLS